MTKAEKEWMRRACCIAGCSKDAARGRKGMCTTHYTRVRRFGDPEATSRIVGDDRARLMKRVNALGSGCWVWMGPLKLGYGIFSIGKRLHQVHRASWMLFVGPIPNGLQVNHKCHNRACVNPDHLYVGDQKQNMRDMIEAGRDKNRARGERHFRAKLTAASVAAIRSSETGRPGELAIRYGVSESTIRAVLKRQVWNHV